MVRFMLAVNNFKSWIRKSIIIIFKPLANLILKIDDMKQDRIKRKCQKMTDEELMSRFAKYIVKYLVRYDKNGEEKFMLFNKRADKIYHYEDFQERIQYRLRNITSSHNDELLKSWYLYNDKSKLYYDDNFQKMIQYEKKLNGLLKKEAEKLGAQATYENLREKDYYGKGNDYDAVGEWLNRIGYEKTLVIKLK